MLSFLTLIACDNVEIDTYAKLVDAATRPPLVLREEGGRLTGSVGPSAEQQMPWRTGCVRPFPSIVPSDRSLPGAGDLARLRSDARQQELVLINRLLCRQSIEQKPTCDSNPADIAPLIVHFRVLVRLGRCLHALIPGACRPWKQRSSCGSYLTRRGAGPR
jgi:hypothetical protein